MKSKQSICSSRNSKTNIQRIDLELESDSFHQNVDVEEDVTAATILVETVSGNVEVKVKGGNLEQLSRYEKVKLFGGRLAKGARSLSIEISSKVKSLIRLTIITMSGFIDRAIDELPCRVCKELCKLAVSATLAHIGIPYLETEKIIDLPAPSLDSQFPNPQYGPISMKDIGVDPNKTIPVDFGKQLNIQDYKSQIEEALGSEGFLAKTLLPGIPNDMLIAIRSALEAVNWIFDATEKIYTGACRIVRCCA